MRNPSVIVLCLLVVAGCGGTLKVDGEGTADTGTEDVAVDSVPDSAEDPAEDSPEDVETEDAATDPPPDTGEDGCTPIEWYQDVDHDGYGDNAMTVWECDPPPGYSSAGGDCDDTDPLVYPGQTEFFTEPRSDGTFDYNCDGVGEYLYPDTHGCSMFDCVDGEGWNEDLPPLCGENGQWIRCSHIGPACSVQPDWRRQACR